MPDQSYTWYLITIIKKLQLKNNIIFLAEYHQVRMAEQMADSNVFVNAILHRKP